MTPKLKVSENCSYQHFSRVRIYIYIPACSVMQSPHEYLVFFFVFVTVMNLVIFLSLSSIFILYVDVFIIALIAHNNTTISVKKRAFNNRFSNCWMREGLQKKISGKGKDFFIPLLAHSLKCLSSSKMWDERKWKGKNNDEPLTALIDLFFFFFFFSLCVSILCSYFTSFFIEMNRMKSFFFFKNKFIEKKALKNMFLRLIMFGGV